MGAMGGMRGGGGRGDFGGRGKGGKGDGKGKGGKGKGGKGFREPEGPPESVEVLGEFMHACEGASSSSPSPRSGRSDQVVVIMSRVDAHETRLAERRLTVRLAAADA